ncbi:membrane protein [Streptomyces poonensis]|uniref:Membrane protein n=1 Tax=Streptomyces poonensis TaxID=68255 RepID=A0A918USP5_9ACTN|nr:membrane protein [Streptomyces poonensis]GLJ88312.1 membrane protein [Streptomyces poonensis]
MNTDSREVAPGRAGALPRRLAVPAGVLAAVTGAFAYVAAVDPNEPGHYPVCPLLHLTGLYCPGCGGLRAAHAFAHGDLATALTANALAVGAFLGFAAVWTVWVVHAVRGRPLRLVLAPVALWSLGAFVLVFTVVRNLPFGGWLHP